MGWKAYDPETIQVFRGRIRYRDIERVVFRDQPHLLEVCPGAVALINYDQGIAAVRQRADGELYIDLTEQRLRGWPPLTRRIISN
jgi:hypothetical protein